MNVITCSNAGWSGNSHKSSEIRDEKSPSNGMSFWSSTISLSWYMSNKLDAVRVLNSRLFFNIEVTSRFALPRWESSKGSVGLENDKKWTTSEERTVLLNNFNQKWKKRFQFTAYFCISFYFSLSMFSLYWESLHPFSSSHSLWNWNLA